MKKNTIVYIVIGICMSGVASTKEKNPKSFKTSI